MSDFADPAPDATPEQWLDGLRGWTPASLQAARDALHRRHIKPLHVAEVKAQRKAEQDTAEGYGDVLLVIGLGIAAAVVGTTAAVVHFTGRATTTVWNAARKAVRRAL